MYLPHSTRLFAVFSLLLLACPPLLVRSVAQSSNLRIVGPDKNQSLVVNEKKPLTLTVVDSNGQPITGVTFESGSPDIAIVDPQTGVVQGQQRGFATITARRGNESVSTFMTVTRVGS